MRNKPKRQEAIFRLISAGSAANQDTLLGLLRAEGFGCTQATLSRNLRELGAGRIPDGKGGYRYSLPENLINSQPAISRLQLLPVITDVVDAKGLLVIRTLPGNANNTAIYIDSAAKYEIAGTIAGDDTILIIPRDGITNHQVHTCLEIILPGLHEQIKRNK